ncbi:MAG: ActS/PrrB/RegB family redox-sensitive histidine kinase [Pseudomonadota bacterium]
MSTPVRTRQDESKAPSLMDLRGNEIRSIRLRTLVTLRWIAIAGQSMAVLAAVFALDVDLPLAGCVAVIGISIWLNLVALWTSTPSQRLTERDTLLTLLFDLAQLTSLLYLTGGLTNPFALFLLGPVTVAATVAPLRTTVGLGVATVFAAVLLALWHVPIVFRDGAAFEPPPLFVIGYAVALAIAVAFQAAYSRRVSVEAFNMSMALNATQMALEKEQRLSSLGAMAASVAHELGTPLATIKLTASELRNELTDRAELAEDAALIREQATRCRDILQRLASIKEADDAQTRRAPIFAVLKEAGGPHLQRRAQIIFRLDGEPIDDETSAQPTLERRPEIINGLRNIIQNAVDFAGSAVWIDVLGDQRSLTVRISDDGPGFSPEILAQIGEPFATTRGSGRRDDAYAGMGLGVFIAKTLLERSGAVISFGNARTSRRPTRETDPQEPTGAVIEIVWREAAASRPST